MGFVLADCGSGVWVPSDQNHTENDGMERASRRPVLVWNAL